MKTILLLLLIAAAALAHHGYAAFDTSAEITLKGAVTDFHFVNPHCVIEFDVQDEKGPDPGKVQNWKAELTSANHLTPKGWSEATVQPGDELAITGYRAKNGATPIWVTKIHLADGRELKIDTSN